MNPDYPDVSAEDQGYSVKSVAWPREAQRIGGALQVVGILCVLRQWRRHLGNQEKLCRAVPAAQTQAAALPRD